MNAPSTLEAPVPHTPVGLPRSKARLAGNTCAHARLRWLRPLRVAELVLREAFAREAIERTPEPEAMDAAGEVAAFDREGEAGGALAGVYAFNARAISRMLPRGGTLLDLGSGSARFLVFLARCRPDVRVYGVELSSEMRARGREAIARAGLTGRVTLLAGDMTELEALAPRRIDAVSAIFSLHHLPDIEHLRRCAEQVGRLRAAHGCGVWIFDHARPRLRRTAFAFPDCFTPDAAAVFKTNSRNSLLAAFSFRELSETLARQMPEAPRGACARLLRLYQAHWLAPRSASPEAAHAEWFAAPALPRRAKSDLRGLHGILPDVPA